MASRNYRLGRRQEAVDQTRRAILTAARDVLAAGGPGFSTATVARRAGVSRITLYNHFGTKDGLLRELSSVARRGTVEATATPVDPRDQLRQRIVDSCTMWASDPALHRHLPAAASGEIEAPNENRALAERLAASDQLRPGCSLKEAEDVIGALTSFAVFDRLHKDGRRSPSAVADVLMRLAGAVLAAA
jgi:AcrR family transcriptional regulator